MSGWTSVMGFYEEAVYWDMFNLSTTEEFIINMNITAPAINVESPNGTLDYKLPSSNNTKALINLKIGSITFTVVTENSGASSDTENTISINNLDSSIRIRVNKTIWDNNDETTSHVLGHPNQFYITYLIPSDGGTFVVEGEVHLNATITDPENTGWWR